MLQVDELTYTAIITITLPDVAEKATVNVTLTPEDNITTGRGQIKRLRDCTLTDLQEYAETLESEIWEEYRAIRISQLAEDELAHVKITIINETGQPVAASPEEWLSHAVLFSDLKEAANPQDELDTAGHDEEPPAPEVVTETEEAPAESSAGEAGEAIEDVAVDVQETTDAAQRSQDLGVETDSAVADEREEAPTAEDIALVEAPTKPEVKVRIAGLRRPTGHDTPSAVDILINEPAFRDAQAHSLTSLDREVAGVLIGPLPEKQPDGRYIVHVTDIIIAKHTRMQGASVTYTPESWRYIHDKLLARYPNEEAMIVGWYHTHPGFGIFLSGMDLFIHQNFFIQLWHIALVLDPVARRCGFFSWSRSKTSVNRYDFPWPTWASNSW